MDRNSYRDDNGTDEPGTYWPRRAIALVGGLGVLGLLIWAMSGSGGKPPASPATGSRSMSAAAYPSTPASPVISATAISATAGADAAVPGLPSPSPSASGTLSPGAKPAATSKPAAAGTTVLRGGRCPASAVVLSLFATRSSYPKGQDPQFSLDAVNTVPGTCTLGVGPAQLHLVVKSGGRVIWDSADCAKPNDTKTARLTRGVPVQEFVSWNRTINLPGCVTVASSPPLGTYTAQAMAGTIASDVGTFKLTH
jgi:hypothetical protein